MSILDALLARFTREEEPVDHDPSLDSWVELWPAPSRSDELDELGVLMGRVDSVQQRLECLDPIATPSEAVVSLATRAAQSSAAIRRCRREPFAPHLRAMLRAKVAKMEAELSVLSGAARLSAFTH